jgi:hypothetical protein
MDPVMPSLRKLPNLRRLMLISTDLSDRGLQELAGMKTLQTLQVKGPYLGEKMGITDAGLPYVALLEDLRELDLSDNPIGPARTYRV